MLSSVRSRPNYYEMLGLKPAASEAQIKEAFAKTMSLLPPPGAAAQVCIAYETLRNPMRRRDYDLSIGVTPTVQPQPTHLTIPLGQQRWAPFIASVPREPVTPAPPPVEPHVTSVQQHPAEPRLEQRLAAPPPDAGTTAAIRHDRPRQPPLDQRFAHAEHRPSGLNRTGLAIGAVVLGVVIMGAWAGAISGNDVEAAQAEQAPVVSKLRPAAPPQGPAAIPIIEDVATTLPERSSVAGRPIDRLRKPKPNSAARARSAEVADLKADEAPLAQAEPIDSAGVAASASMPVPDKVIARTIDRIGYACGGVASTMAVAGQPGVFTVSCTSGRSFQAKPVGGRYRFRKLG